MGVSKGMKGDWKGLVFGNPLPKGEGKGSVFGNTRSIGDHGGRWGSAVYPVFGDIRSFDPFRRSSAILGDPVGLSAFPLWMPPAVIVRRVGLSASVPPLSLLVIVMILLVPDISIISQDIFILGFMGGL